MRLLAAIAVPAVACACAGCATPMDRLQGDRDLTTLISGAAPDPARVPGIFTLRNPTLGSVRVESVRVPIGTEVTTEPALPASIGPGGILVVAVTASFRAAEGDGVRRIQLQSAGQPDVVLAVRGRFEPRPPADASPPEPVSGAPGW